MGPAEKASFLGRAAEVRVGDLPKDGFRDGTVSQMSILLKEKRDAQKEKKEEPQGTEEEVSRSQQHHFPFLPDSCRQRHIQ